MPIHEQGYRRRETAVPLRRFRALPIARLALMQIVARRALIVFLGLALIPLALSAFVLFLTTRIPDLAVMLSPLPAQFGRYVLLQSLFAVLITVWAGAGLVADDFRTGALLVYFSRPLTRADYVVGKLGVLVVLNLVVTAVPSLMLWLLAVAFDSRDLVGRGLAFLPGSILALSLAAALLLGILGLAAGAATKNAMMGGALVVGALVLPEIAAWTAPLGVKVPLQMISIVHHLSVFQHALFGVPPEPETLHWSASLACAAVIAWLAARVLWRRLQAVEVVS